MSGNSRAAAAGRNERKWEGGEKVQGQGGEKEQGEKRVRKRYRRDREVGRKRRGGRGAGGRGERMGSVRTVTEISP